MTDMTVDVLKRRSFKSKLAKIRQRGLTLVEAATVLAILAIVVAGTMVIYTNADSSRKTTTALNQLATIQQAVRGIYGSQPTFSGLSTQVVADSEQLPRSMISGATIRHAFNGSVTLSAAAAGGGSDSGFQAQFSNIPKDPCVKLLTSDLGRGLWSVSTGAATRSQDGTPPPFDPGSANSACSSNSNTISWVFR